MYNINGSVICFSRIEPNSLRLFSFVKSIPSIHTSDKDELLSFGDLETSVN